MNLRRLHIGCGMCLFLAFAEAKAQCVPDFSTIGLDGQPLSAGCIPFMIIQFIDNSNCAYITSPFYSHTWKFGDVNNTVTHVREPVFGYFDPGNYNITLVVTSDGINYDSTTKSILVYQPPSVRMAASPRTGCDPLTVTFTNTSFASGTGICETLIDFGDGIVRKKSGVQALDTFRHTYHLIPQQRCWTVTVKVTDCRGCDSTKTYTNMVCIDRPPDADFSANNTLICSQPFAVTFLNSSLSVNPLAYQWYFGDGGRSTLQNPVHTYNTVGCFTDTLIVTDTRCGYTDTMIKPNYVCTSNIDADFNASQTVVCAGLPTQFHDASVGNGINSWSWNFGDGAGTSTAQNPSYTYPTSGTFTVTLTVRDAAGCTSTETKVNIITARPRPPVSFIASDSSSCKAPLNVTFTAQQCAGCTYAWNFGDGGAGTGRVATHTYGQPGHFNVTLEVTDANGCTNRLTKTGYINILPGIVAFTSNVDRGCAPLTVNFSDNSTGTPPFVMWFWNFGDSVNSPGSNTSTVRNPTHVFPDTGKFVVTLTAATAGMVCTGTVTDTILVGLPLVPAFSIDSNPACVNEAVVFTNMTDISGIPPADTNKIQWLWNFAGAQTTGNGPHTRYFDEPSPPNDSLEATLTVNYNGCTSDTTLRFFIHEPKAEFTAVPSCASPGLVIITDSSRGADRWRWYFGNGDSLWMPEQRPHKDTLHYTYAASGNYMIRLIVENTVTGCKTETTQPVSVSITRANFIADKQNVCAGENITFTSQSLGQQLIYQWNFGDIPPGTSTLQAPVYAYTLPDTYDVTLVVTDISGCADTLTRRNYITVKSVNADFTSIGYGCIPPTGSNNTITFTDLSSASPGSTIGRWEWTFDANGSSLTYTTYQPTVTHTYASAGLYTVSLKVTTSGSLQCTDTETKVNHVDMRRPVACFESHFGVFCEDDTAVFSTFCSQGAVNVSWDYGDGSPPDNRGWHVYADTGCYDVTMSISDNYGCSDSYSLANALCVSNPFIDFVGDDTSSVCPPHLACFTDLSSFQGISIRNWSWDFGDGSYSIYQNPCHIYNRAGRFAVTLHVGFANYCVDTLTKVSYIFVGGATGNITAEPDTGCSPLNVCFDANSSGAVSHYWIWGDGTQGALRTDDTACHIYRVPNSYIPAVVLTDAQSPPCSYVLHADFNLLVDTVYADFGTASDTVCRDDAVLFHDSSSSLIDSFIIKWEWDFGDGTPAPPDTTRHPVHVFRTWGPKTVCLTAHNRFGCSASMCKPIYVRDKPTATFTVSDNTGCDTLRVDFFDASTPGVSAPITRWYWDFGDPRTTGDISVVQSPVSYTYRDTGQYSPYLVVTDADGCDDTTFASIGVYRTPAGILTNDTLQICFGDTVQLLSDPGYMAYQWRPNRYLSNATISNPLAYPLDTISYTVDITEAHGCDKLDTVTINVVPLPPLSVTPYPDTMICYGDTIQLHAAGGTNHVWQPWHGIIDDYRIPNPHVRPDFTTTYIVTNEGVGGCKNTDSVRVIVSRLTAIYSADSTCFGDSTYFVDLSTFTDLPVISWRWTFGDTRNNTSLFRNPAHLYSRSGNFTSQLVVRDAIGCTDTATLVVRVDTPATAVAGWDTTICLGESVSLFSSGGEIVYWMPQVPGEIDRPYSFNPLVTPSSTTVFIAHITNGVCPFDTAAVNVTVMPPPDVRTIDNTTILRGTNIQLVTTVDRYHTIVWSPVDSLSCANCLSPFASPDAKITYTVTIIDEFGCVNTDEVTINVTVGCEEDQIFVANAFTPNGDNINDRVYVRLIGLEKMNYFKVYDRWGKLMFETKNVHEGWDGTGKDGEKLNTGVYVYVCEAVCYYKQTIVKSGNVTLIK